MYSNDYIASLYSFLNQTPEGALRKMLVGAELTEAHFRILVKLAKGADESNFIECFNGDTMGQLRLSPKESPLKDNFWNICKKKFATLGLLRTEKAA